MKLKINKTFTKGPRKKNKNQNNEDQMEKIILKIWIEGYH
jgi:hypothetical protein